jgi:hypothetical protein
MQIIEVTDWGARSGVLQLQRKETPLRFIVFPMIHLADARFYEAVHKRLGDCQIIVAEGIQGPSSSTRAITRSYRLLRRKRSLGMVVQNIDYGDLDAQVICPDLTGREMDRGWRRIPWMQRLCFALLVPMYVIWMLCFGSRRVMSRHLAIDDLPSPKDQAMDDAWKERFGDADALIVGRRDRLLLDALSEIHDEHSDEPINVGVVYGAGHVTAIVRALHQRYGYIARSGEWLDLFSL